MYKLNKGANDMKFVISTQYLENYGAHCEDGKFSSGNAYWKMKGGSDYIVSGLTRVQDAIALLDREIGDNDTMMASVEHPQMDLHPTEGWFQSTKKAMTVHDINGKAYVVTVEEAPILNKN